MAAYLPQRGGVENESSAEQAEALLAQELPQAVHSGGQYLLVRDKSAIAALDIRHLSGHDGPQGRLI